MTPAVLQPLFERLRKEGVCFCVNNKNYNKVNGIYNKDSNNLSGGGGGGD
ncbi:hypothetical protein [Helicobacter ganmani]